MAQFPKKESHIDVLADTMISGFRNHDDDFPSPPVTPAKLQASLEAFRSAWFRAREAAAAARKATGEKDEALKKLVAEMKSDIRYAENTTNYDHGKLLILGWGGRHPKRPTATPGQVPGFNILTEGAGWIELSWQKPVDGGEVRAYKIERTREGDESWEIAGMATGTSVMLSDQERGVEWWYRVVAVNAVGEGPESAIAEAVL